MKAPRIVLSLVVFVAGCSPEGTGPRGDQRPEPVQETRAEAGQARPAQTNQDPCAPLRAGMVRYDTAGKPFAFSFEIPEGFVVKDFSRGETVNADVTLDLDGKGGDEYVLRIAYNTKVLENPEGLVTTWRKLPTTLKVLEKNVDGRTMYVQRTSMGEMTGFNVLFPVFESPKGSYSVIGGMTSTPKPCRALAADVVEQMLMSFERNRQAGPVPPA